MEELNHTVKYLCHGPIEGLHLRVTLRRVSGTTTGGCRQQVRKALPSKFDCMLPERKLKKLVYFRLPAARRLLAQLATMKRPHVQGSLRGKRSCLAW